MGFKDKLKKNEFSLVAEFTPPKGTDITQFLEHAGMLKGMVDAVLVPELPGAVMRMGSLGGSAVLHQIGLEPIMEITARDRNLLALQADILSAAAIGIKNITVAQADPPQAGDMPDAKAVDDLNMTQLLSLLNGLNNRRDFAGTELSAGTNFTFGVTASQTLKNGNPDQILDGIKHMSEGGIDFIITPPVFDSAGVASAMTLCRTQGFKIIPTVMVLKSVGMARYIQSHSDRIKIPETVIERIQMTESVQWESIRIAREIIAILKKEGCAGVLISSFGWESVIPEILKP